MSLDIFDRIFILLYYYFNIIISVYYIITSLVVCWSSVSIRMIFIIFKCVSVWLYSFCGKWESLVLADRFHHTSWMGVATPTDYPMLVRNRCVIEVNGGVLFCHFFILCGYKGFCHGSESDVILTFVLLSMTYTVLIYYFIQISFLYWRMRIILMNINGDSYASMF